MLQVKTFYGIDNIGSLACEQVQKEVNAFLFSLSRNNFVVSVHPSLVDVPEAAHTHAYTAYAVMIVYENNE